MMRLLFQGRKTFWVTKSSLELVIFEFPLYGVYEIIAYDPVLQKHAPRLYININTVHNILECCNRNRKESGNTLIVENDETISTYLFNHIIITDYLPISKIVKISILMIFLEEKCCDNAVPVLIVKRPVNLPFIRSPFMNSLEHQQVKSLEISLRDKCLIIVRVSKGLPLRESDALIWSLFTDNRTQEELIVTLTNALSLRIPNESKDILRSTVLAAVLPDNCPFPVSPSNSNPPTPRTYMERPGKSGVTTPSTGSRFSSTAPTRVNTPRLRLSWTSSTTTVVATITTTTGGRDGALNDSSPVPMIPTGTSALLQRSLATLNLSHLTLRIPAAAAAAAGVSKELQHQQQGPSRPTRPSYNSPCTPHSTTSTCSGTSSTATTPTTSTAGVRVRTASGSILIRSQGSMEGAIERESLRRARHRRGRSLGGMWAERWDPSTPTSTVSKSAPTTPQYTSSRVLPFDAPTAGAALMEGWEGEEEGEGLVAAMRVQKPDPNAGEGGCLGALALRSRWNAWRKGCWF